jgi:hypothetical protein
MILIEDHTVPPEFAEDYSLVMRVMSKTSHGVHRFSSVEALEAFLEAGLDQLSAAGFPRGLRRIVLFYRDFPAVVAVAQRMLPGFEFEAWPLPDAWPQLAEQLRTKARKPVTILGRLRRWRAGHL